MKLGYYKEGINTNILIKQEQVFLFPLFHPFFISSIAESEVVCFLNQADM